MPPVRSGGVVAVPRAAGRMAVDWARRYPLAPRYRPPATHLSLTSADGTRLHAVRLPGPLPAAARGPTPSGPPGPGSTAPPPCTFVLVHGLANSSRTPGIFVFAHLLAAVAPVVVLDLRGHGSSGGHCSFCIREPDDVDAAVQAARVAAPDLPVVTIGTSLGGSSVLLHAGGHGGVAGAVGISPAGWSGADDRRGSARAQQVARSPVARAGLRLLTGTRLPPACDAVPHAEPVVARIAPAFTLVVHDREDHYLGPEHAESIERWARPPVERWELVGKGHGTELLDAGLAERIVAHVRAHV
jgi:pimeloyl-ACP methyl ester carboxylesterase